MNRILNIPEMEQFRLALINTYLSDLKDENTRCEKLKLYENLFYKGCNTIRCKNCVFSRRYLFFRPGCHAKKDVSDAFYEYTNSKTPEGLYSAIIRLANVIKRYIAWAEKRNRKWTLQLLRRL